MSNDHGFFDSPNFDGDLWQDITSAINANGWADPQIADTGAAAVGEGVAVEDTALELPGGAPTALSGFSSSEPQCHLIGELHGEMLPGEAMEADHQRPDEVYLQIDGLPMAGYGFWPGNDTTDRAQDLHTGEWIITSPTAWSFQGADASFQPLPATAAIVGDSAQPTGTPRLGFEWASAGDAAAEQQQCGSQCVGVGVAVGDIQCEDAYYADVDAISNSNADAKGDAKAAQHHVNQGAAVAVAVGDIDRAGDGGTGLTISALVQQIQRHKRQAGASGSNDGASRNSSHNHQAEVTSNPQFDARNVLPFQLQTSELIGGASVAVQPEEASRAGDKLEPLKRKISEIRKEGNKRAKLIGPAASAPTPTTSTTPATSTTPSPSAPAIPTSAESAASGSDGSAADTNAPASTSPSGAKYRWHNNGNKVIDLKGEAPFLRKYYRCSLHSAGCRATKTIDVVDGQPPRIAYNGAHNHAPPGRRARQGRTQGL